MGCKEIYLMIVIFVCSGVFYSCSDDIVEVLPESSIRDRPNQDLQEVDFDRDDVRFEGVIKLGRKRINPFTIENINYAKSKMYGSTLPDKVLTHKYVKFSPTTQEHIDILENWEDKEDFSLFDFPLEYEIENDGEHYIDPSVADELYTFQYGAIPTNINFPQVPYDVIDDLYLDKSDPLLLVESFWFTGNHKEINEYLLHGGLTSIQVGGYNDEVIAAIKIPLMPDTPCAPGYEWRLVLDDSGFILDDNPAYVWECRPKLPPPPPVLNDCGCEVPSNRRYPAGCVRVDDDGFMEGVQIASIKVKDKWFGSNKTYTDENGCWKVNKRHSGNVWVWVRFKNKYVKAKDTGYWLGIRSIVDFAGKKQAPPYNKITVNYSNGITDNDSKARKYWAAAHTLNTVFEHRVAAVTDGVPLPKDDLNWINKSGLGGASAPMLQWQPFSSWPALLAASNFTGIALLSLPFQPDITNRYRFSESAAQFNSSGFHELGHASHYTVAGEGYWFGYRNHIINNGGYGSFGNFQSGSSPGKVALGEAIGSYAGARYTNNLVEGENIAFDDPIFVSPENFIPRGLIWDLIDDVEDVITDPNTLVSFTDNISGFTPNMIFNSLSPEVDDIRSFRDRLRLLHLGDTPNNVADYNTFVDGYDVFN